MSQTGIRMFLPGKEDVQPPPLGPASGSVVKASVEQVELSTAANDATVSEENFESILPGKILDLSSGVK